MEFNGISIFKTNKRPVFKLKMNRYLEDTEGRIVPLLSHVLYIIWISNNLLMNFSTLDSFCKRSKTYAMVINFGDLFTNYVTSTLFHAHTLVYNCLVQPIVWRMLQLDFYQQPLRLSNIEMIDRQYLPSLCHAL